MNKGDMDIIDQSVQYTANPNIKTCEFIRSGVMSFGQQRLWFLSKFGGDNVTYNIPVVLELEGNIDIKRVEGSIYEIVNRHEILRTFFTLENELPTQTVVAKARGFFNYIDGLQCQLSEKHIESIVEDESRRHFDLSKPPLFRAKLIRKDYNRFLLILVWHHIIFDGWSIGVFMNEFTELYNMRSLPPLSMQYLEFSSGQREALDGRNLVKQLKYWSEQLYDAPRFLNLPYDRPRPSVQTYKGAIYEFQVSEELFREIKSLSKTYRLTVYMTLVSVFIILLSRYSGQEDLLVGTPIANRTTTEIEDLIGFFVNTLVIRGKVAHNPTLNEFLTSMRQVCIDAFSNQALPFEKIIESLNPTRELSHTPLFQVMFAFQNMPSEQFSHDEVRVSRKDKYLGFSEFDLSLYMEVNCGALYGSFEYNTDLFDVDTIRRMADSFITLLEYVVQNQNVRVNNIPIIPNHEYNMIVHEWNKNGSRNYSTRELIHQIIHNRGIDLSDSIAISHGEKQVTYGSLNDLSDKIALYLADQGVRPNVLVGVYMERSIDAIIAILGILKAGGAFVPLDPSYPSERLSFMIDDSNVGIVITDTNGWLDLSELRRARSMSYSQILKMETACVMNDTEISNISDVVSGSDLAYVSYTSGSTGRPKGVMIEHSSLLNAYHAWEELYKLNITCKTHMQMASMSFDVFIGDLVRSLCSGGELVICDREILLSPPRLYDLMVKKKIEIAEFVPLVLQGLIRYVREVSKSLDFMKVIICGSDRWNRNDIDELTKVCGNNTVIVNSFGVTECTIDSSCFFVGDNYPNQNNLVPIGRPIPNVDIFLLDPSLQPVPIGVVGEIYIGGAGVGRGYLGMDKLTSEKFVLNKFRQDKSKRMYRTGDLGRYLPSGDLEYVGRVDRQLKIRGYRIEPGEIEYVINSHVNVRESYVCSIVTSSGVAILTAYIATDPFENVGANFASELKTHLTQYLPSYMVPAQYVLVRGIPMMPNGKVDETALQAGYIEQESSTFAAPTTKLEIALCELFSKILDLKQVSIDDNFFAVGGHSMLAVLMVEEIRKLFEGCLPLEIIFKYPTVRDMSKYLQSIRVTSGE